MLNRLYPVVRPLLFTLEPERAHALTLNALTGAHALGLLHPNANDSDAVSLMGLSFPNRVGLAAGFDKNASHIDALGALGFGFIEVGTVTLRPQAGQPKPRLFRLRAADALVNRMGFPNDGAAAVADRLARRTYRGVCGVNIGKNAATDLDQAPRDYIECFRTVARSSDYVAINVSSPNTKDLRRLQQADRLRAILDGLMTERERMYAGEKHRVPLLIKISPDLSAADLHAVAMLVRELGVDGVIASNSTLSREGVAGAPHAHEEGGLSGPPLRRRSIAAVRALRSALGPQTAIVAVGGVDSGAAAVEALAAGADLVQIYTGLVYRGPQLVADIRSALRDANTAIAR